MADDRATITITMPLSEAARVGLAGLLNHAVSPEALAADLADARAILGVRPGEMLAAAAERCVESGARALRELAESERRLNAAATENADLRAEADRLRDLWAGDTIRRISPTGIAEARADEAEACAKVADKRAAFLRAIGGAGAWAHECDALAKTFRERHAPSQGQSGTVMDTTPSDAAPTPAAPGLGSVTLVQGRQTHHPNCPAAHAPSSLPTQSGECTCAVGTSGAAWGGKSV